MKILGFNFQQRRFIQNKQYDYSGQYRSVLKNPNQTDTFCRSNDNKILAFTGKERQEQISREPLVKLYKEGLNCMCCGREMIDPKIIDKMAEDHVFACSTKEAIRILEKYEKNMHTVERAVFNLLKKQAELHPDKNIKQHIVELKKTHEKPLIQKQVGIFKLIDKASSKIKPELHEEIREYLLESFELIKQGDNNFSRMRFINGLNKILENYPNTANKEKLIRLAGKLPTAYDDVDAFIVKYANPRFKPEAVAIRLLSYSMATIEHIHPQDSKDVKGPNHLYNYVPECMRCNSFRSNKPMTYQLEDYPEMFINAQNLFDRLIDFANQGKLSKMYIIKLYKAIRHESEGVLELDYSRMKLNKELKKELEKPFSYPINPTPANKNIVPKPLPTPDSLPIDLPENKGIEKEVIKSTTEPQTPSTIQTEIKNYSPIISKKRRKKLVAEENNLQHKIKGAKPKKSKTENKETVRRGSNRR